MTKEPALKYRLSFQKTIIVLNIDMLMPREKNTPNGYMDARLSVKSAKVVTTLTRLSHVLLYPNTALPLMSTENVPLVFKVIK